jgi:hypothetical protein
MGSRPHRRRRTAACLHLRAPGAVPRRADRPDTARGGRLDDRGDRQRLPDIKVDDRAADRAGKENAGRRRRAVRGTGSVGVSAAALGGAQRCLPDLQRGLFGVVRATLDSRRAVHRGAAAGAHPRGAGARRTGGACAGGVDGVPVVEVRGPHRLQRHTHTARGPGPHEMGPRADPAWSDRAGPRRCTRAARRHRPRRLRPAGRTGRMPRHRGHAVRHRLGPDSAAV